MTMTVADALVKCIRSVRADTDLDSNVRYQIEARLWEVAHLTGVYDTINPELAKDQQNAHSV